MDKLAPQASLKHRIPVIDRMMEVLGQLEVRENGASISDLVSSLKLPRTTVYRIVNSLQAHDVVHRDEAGVYRLGRRLLGLASHVAAAASPLDLVSFGTPVLERLSADLGEGSKLSIIDGDGILVLAAAQGRRSYALSVAPGQRMPIHAGAAGKLLLSHLTRQEIDAWLERPLVAYTSRTVTDPKRLRNELTRIRRLGWAQDRGETGPSILAYAAPVFDAHGKMVAALSVPFLQGTEASQMEQIRLAVIEAGRSMTRTIAGAA